MFVFFLWASKELRMPVAGLIPSSTIRHYLMMKAHNLICSCVWFLFTLVIAAKRKWSIWGRAGAGRPHYTWKWNVRFSLIDNKCVRVAEQPFVDFCRNVFMGGGFFLLTRDSLILTIQLYHCGGGFLGGWCRNLIVDEKDWDGIGRVRRCAIYQAFTSHWAMSMLIRLHDLFSFHFCFLFYETPEEIAATFVSFIS